MNAMQNARRRMGLTVAEVAHAVGTDDGNMSRIDRGLQTPKRELALRLHQFFRGEVSLLHILGYEDEEAA